VSKQNVILEARNIVKYYGEQKVLDIENFTLYKGAFNFLIGPNGSGKTTFLQILSLVDKDYRGELYYKGEAIDYQRDNLLKSRRKFSVIWQNPYLYKGSVSYNIGLPLRLRGVNKKSIHHKVKQMAEKLAITELLSKRHDQISGGEKQKVSIARALITEPEIIFVDEPTNSLDKESISFFNQHFSELVTDEMTVLLITHDLTQVKRLANHINSLDKGKLIYQGCPREYNSNNFHVI